ncbi:putative oxidoreductase with NAD(P)-binding Rossmann-fold domain [Sulfurovum sp. enrichment culture clone C5]|uniref:Putative oxidoreductase with NAD(P)-binding Rossmann-fold domain n=1 Tax=Sulfurovum sp. enrichment culture clone C5 TaxID=497650 RepID=A0A0S4XMV4_9BACT|nr:putative oxidoreductase with NAD(P)-binding Rossmann-fold domain [Sulfurovum sp. enrichment culture clone C5]
MMNKVVVITGCSSGIGLTTAKHLKENQMSVCATARKTEDVKKLKKIGFDAYKLDVTNNLDIKNTIEEIVNKYGKIDVWFNNAGYGQPGAIEDLPTKALREQFEINVFGMHECTIQILEVFKKQGYGTIIQHSSVLGIISLFGRGAYNASKYAIEGLSDTLRLELTDTKIKVITLNTGPITSDFRKNATAKLQENIDIENSRFKELYHKGLKGEGKKVPFNEEAMSVAKIVHKIIVSKKPKPRYYITKATYLLGFLKRILSTTMLDKILLKI